MNIKKQFLIGCIVALATTFAYNKAMAQDYSKNSLTVGFGFGASMGRTADGLGSIYVIGYQKTLKNQRIRFNPNFSIGQYSSKFVLDARDQYFNSMSLEANLNYDLIKIEAFSVVVSCGTFLNNTRGLKGTGGDPEGYTEPQYSKYISDYYAGASVSGGFRINSPNKRTALNLTIINLHIGNNDFAESHLKIGIDFKF